MNDSTQMNQFKKKERKNLSIDSIFKNLISQFDAPTDQIRSDETNIRLAHLKYSDNELQFKNE